MRKLDVYSLATSKDGSGFENVAINSNNGT